MSIQYYPALVLQDPGDGPNDGYGIVFPDFPGCVSDGDTADAAASAGAEALTLHIEAMRQAGEAIPSPGPRNVLPDWLRGEALSIVEWRQIPINVPSAARSSAKALG